jgi:mRNA interferase MazF
MYICLLEYRIIYSYDYTMHGNNNHNIHRFDEWNDLKKTLHSNDFRPYFKAREIWWASLGQNIGDEENGKNERFDRPVLIIQKFYNNLLLALPLSTKVKEGSYYFRIRGVKVDGIVILSQSRIIDAKRLIRRIEILDLYTFECIKKKYIDLL